MKLELTHIDPLTLLDTDTYDAVMSGNMTKEIVEMNLDIYEGCELLQIGNVGFAVSEIDSRKFIHPFKVNVGTRNYRYAFVCFDHDTEQLFWFFKGISKTQNRDEALSIYDALKDYCKTLEGNFSPFIIKR
jgi:hypothetical protein